jgi:hypothetical protein
VPGLCRSCLHARVLNYAQLALTMLAVPVTDKMLLTGAMMSPTSTR